VALVKRLQSEQCSRTTTRAQILSYRLTHFSSTPHRVAYLRGLLLECKGNLAGARELYEQCLNHDETDVVRRFYLPTPRGIRLTRLTFAELPQTPYRSPSVLPSIRTSQRQGHPTFTSTTILPHRLSLAPKRHFPPHAIPRHPLRRPLRLAHSLNALHLPRALPSSPHSPQPRSHPRTARSLGCPQVRRDDIYGG
jgi:hypothetical protein